MEEQALAGRIDHTLLGPTATEAGVRKLCEEAVRLGVASVCINPCHTQLAHALVDGTPVKVCVVIGFPHGMTTTETKVFEAQQAIDQGAEELDMVMRIGAMKENDLVTVSSDIRAVCEVAHNATPRVDVKVILEMCLLNEDEKQRAATAAVEAGADFVKTSTGFSTGGATLEDVRLLRRVVGSRAGVKAAGGIRTREAALAMLEAGASRIGASRTAEILSGPADNA